MKRVFAGIKVPFNKAFLQETEEIKAYLYREKIRWVNPENLHITLKFFGETENDRIEQITAALNELAKKARPFLMEINSLGIFRSIEAPGVLWLGIKYNPDLLVCENLFSSLLNERDLIRDMQKDFNPHLTIGRMKKIKEKKDIIYLMQKFEKYQFISFHVNKICLFESKLSQSGSVYSEISSFSLKNS